MAWSVRRGRASAFIAVALSLALAAGATAAQGLPQGAADASQAGAPGLATGAPSVNSPRNVSTAEDTVASFNLLANVTDPDGEGFSLTAPLGTSLGVHGNLTCAASGACTYTPFSNDSGLDSFGFTVKDTAGDSSSGILNVTVNAANDPPTVSSPRNLQTPEETEVAFNLLAGAADVDSVSIQLTSPPYATPTATQHGKITCAVDGACTYKPNPNYVGPDTFPFTATDSDGGAKSGIVQMTVTGTPDAPTITSPRIVTTPEDTPLEFNMLQGAVDPDGDPISLAYPVGSFTLAHGTLVCAATGACTYTPIPNDSGTDPFTFGVADNTGGTTAGTGTITVTKVNDLPTIDTPRAFSTDEETPRSFNLLDGAADVDSVSIKLTAPSGTVDTAHGKVSCVNGGACTYTPAANYNGPDTFNFTVTDSDGGARAGVVNITVNPTNDPPTIDAPRYISTDEDTARTFNLLRNASDADGDNYSLTDPPFGPTPTDHGSITCRVSGRCTYTPAANYVGPDTFNFTVEDTTGQTKSGTVYITVRPINDAPTTPTRNLATNEDTSLTFNLLTPVTDPDSVSVELTFPIGDTATEHGKVTCNSSGACTYKPNASYNGPDTFPYTVLDSDGASKTGVVNLTINPVADNPKIVTPRNILTDEDTPRTFNLLNGASDADGDELELTAPLGSTPLSNGTLVCAATGSCTFTPTANLGGSASLPFTVTDSTGATANGVLNITVNPVNDPPTATNKNRTIAEDTSVNVNVLNGAIDPEGGPLTLIDPVPGEPTFTANGTVVCVDSGVCRYTPNPNFTGIDRYFFTVVDNGGLGATARVTITVTPVNDPPLVVSPREIVVNQGEPATIDVLKGAGDPDGDEITVTAWTDGAHGTVTCHTGGVCTYTPEPSFRGPTDSFTFTASDPSSASDTGSVIVTIIPANNPPVVGPRSINTTERTPASINVVSGVKDPEGGVITFKEGNNGEHGVVNCTGGGLCTYTPVKNFVGTDMFTYVITDGTHLVTGTVTVRVFPGGPNAPRRYGANFTGDGTSNSCGVLSGDPDCSGGSV